MKLFEEFMQSDYELDRIINQIMNRIKYWFSSGSFSITSVLVDQNKSSTPNVGKRSIIANFADADFYYQLIIKFNIEDLEKCEVIIKKYDSSTIDEINGSIPIWYIELTNSKKVDIDDIKEDFIMQKISEKEDDFNENPDENKIKIPKDNDKEQKSQPQNNPGQGGVAEFGGGPTL